MTAMIVRLLPAKATAGAFLFAACAVMNMPSATAADACVVYTYLGTSNCRDADDQITAYYYSGQETTQLVTYAECRDQCTADAACQGLTFQHDDRPGNVWPDEVASAPCQIWVPRTTTASTTLHTGWKFYAKAESPNGDLTQGTGKDGFGSGRSCFLQYTGEEHCTSTTANPVTTTASPSTASPTTAPPSTASPSTASPTTASPTTAAQSTASPSTASASTTASASPAAATSSAVSASSATAVTAATGGASSTMDATTAAATAANTARPGSGFRGTFNKFKAKGCGKGAAAKGGEAAGRSRRAAHGAANVTCAELKTAFEANKQEAKAVYAKLKAARRTCAKVNATRFARESDAVEDDAVIAALSCAELEDEIMTLQTQASAAGLDLEASTGDGSTTAPSGEPAGAAAAAAGVVSALVAAAFAQLA